MRQITNYGIGTNSRNKKRGRRPCDGLSALSDYLRLLRPMRLATMIALPPPSASIKPSPNSTSAPVAGVVVLAPRTLTDGVRVDVLDVVVSVTIVVFWVDDVVDDEELVMGADSVVLELLELLELLDDDELELLELEDELDDEDELDEELDVVVDVGSPGQVPDSWNVTSVVVLSPTVATAYALSSSQPAGVLT